MELLGMTVAQLSAVCRGQTAGVTRLGGEHVIVLGLHNAGKGTAAQGLKIESLTLLSPEDARGLALTLWSLADEVEKRSADEQAGKEGC